MCVCVCSESTILCKRSAWCTQWNVNSGVGRNKVINLSTWKENTSTTQLVMIIELSFIDIYIILYYIIYIKYNIILLFKIFHTFLLPPFFGFGSSSRLPSCIGLIPFIYKTQQIMNEWRYWEEPSTKCVYQQEKVMYSYLLTYLQCLLIFNEHGTLGWQP